MEERNTEKRREEIMRGWKEEKIIQLCKNDQCSDQRRKNGRKGNKRRKRGTRRNDEEEKRSETDEEQTKED